MAKHRRRGGAKYRARAVAGSISDEALIRTFEENKERIKKEAVRRIRKDLEVNAQRWPMPAPYDESVTIRSKLHAGLIDDFCFHYPKRIDANSVMRALGVEHKPFHLFVARELYDTAVYQELLKKTGSPKLTETAISYRLRDSGLSAFLYTEVMVEMTPEVVARALSKNPRYERTVKPVLRKMEAWAQLSADFRESTPDNYALFFPEARGMQRHFVLHLGPTNSGKTYESVKRLEEAESGIYLAPLRLLAYEQFERINRDGVYCSMVTGEERILVDGATHQSSTIEMWNPSARYEVAVIDEAQMIADPDRGSAWTNAILGVQAKEVYVCASPDAKRCLIRMIKSCGDTFEVVSHERKTPLVMEEKEFNFPEDVEDGDALIVFSRRDVHGVAADLKRAGLSCSIIYGALPYDVRHREAERFARGETKVVVATDAIGMGMNLPIRRVVFLQTEKFDGRVTRQLRESEVKQIAGRAGRYGIYDTGYVQSFGDNARIEELLHERPRTIEKAVIGIPADFFWREGNISDILRVWDELPATQDYDKGDIEEKIKIAEDLEAIAEEKELVYQFTKFSVDRDDRETYGLLKSFFRLKSVDVRPDVEEPFFRYDPKKIEITPEKAGELETMYRVFDFLYAYSVVYEDEEILERILKRKREISEALMEILESGYIARTCKNCGRKLAWNYPFGLCDKCYRENGAGESFRRTRRSSRK